MKRRGIGVLVIQETHRPNSDYFVTAEGYFVILSGATGDGKERAGVGFIIAPDLRRSVVGFSPISDRLAVLKLRVTGGKMAVINGYAPHDGKHFDQRQRFFSELGQLYAETSAHGVKMICGDLNSRIHKKTASDQEALGDYIFGNSAANLKAGGNRQLLMELCTSQGLAVANTFFDHPCARQITYYELGAHPQSVATPANFAQLDLALLPHEWLPKVTDIASDRGEALASRHFLVEITLQCDVQKTPLKSRDACLKVNRRALQYFSVRRRFTDAFHGEMLQTGLSMQDNTIDESILGINGAFKSAAGLTLPQTELVPNKPWIRHDTLVLIKQRNCARTQGRHSDETALNKRVRMSAKRDRGAWLDNLVETGDWAQIRRLRKGFRPKQGRLKDSNGKVVSSEDRAQTMADYLQSVQWAVRPVTASPDRAPLGPTLNVQTGSVQAWEVKRAAKGMKNNRASGDDTIPSEFWRAVLAEEGPAATWLVEFCQKCWSTKQVPEEWHLARIATIFKKGDPGDCANYRPISLLNVAYKLFASILLHRLRDAGADARLWPTQFGFKQACGTDEALLIARRYIEKAWASKEGSCLMLALDWAKAFDSIDPQGLIRALRRFGLPEGFIDMVQAIYTSRRFRVQDCGCSSEWCHQQFGICQGCPLSPFLFVIVMTVLMTDAKEAVRLNLEPAEFNELSDLLYADDTLLLAIKGPAMEVYLAAVAQAGAEYGLSLHLGKTQLLRVKSNEAVHKNTGEAFVPRDSMVYLGGLLAGDGKPEQELSRRIGLATADFKALTRVWSHSVLSRSRKLHIFHACVVSVLFYGLKTVWLSAVSRRRLDGFYVRCLRKILRIPASYYSRVSNKTVLDRADSKQLSQQLLAQQLCYFGKLALRSNGPARDSVFRPGAVFLAERAGLRPRGRPRDSWGEQVFKHAVLAAGGADQLVQLLSPGASLRAWRCKARVYALEL
jgi:hypothetical protein